MSGFLGEALDSGVKTQLAVRQQLLEAPTRTNAHQMLLNSNTAWVALYSGVLTGTYGKQGTTFKLEGGVGFQDDAAIPGLPAGYWASTNTGQSTGIRPRAGITDVRIKSKGTYGTLRDVEINIKAWTTEDFETLYDLYMRPGFHFLLEWGHSVYAQSGTSIAQTRPTASGTFLQNSVSYKKVMDDVVAKRKASGYNYDGLVGVCKNFSWALNEQGGYDITINLISKGEVIESIGVAFDPSNKISSEQLKEGNKDKSERKSPIHFLLKRIELANTDGAVSLATVASSGKAADLLAGLDANKFDVFCKTGFDIEQPGSMFDKSAVLTWISLRTICDLLNNFAVTKEGPDKGQVAFEINTEPGHRYVTHDCQFSIDPIICVLSTPNQATMNGNELGKVTLTGTDERIAKLRPLSNDPLAICVTNLYLYDVLDPLFDRGDAKENPPSLLDTFKAILGGVNEAMGGINELELAYDEDENKWSIVDRKWQEDPNKLPTIKLTGLGSNIRTLKTESKISNKISSQVSIAASAGRSGTKENVDELLAWNRGHKDRIAPVKKQTDKGDNTKPAPIPDEAKAFAEWAERVDEAFQAVNGGLLTDQNYDKDSFQALKSGHQKYSSEYLALKNGKGNEAPKGIIPVELSFTMQGISGFKIAQGFKIETGLIPSHYTGNNMAYLVTRCDHTISNNEWITEVGALMYNAKPAPGYTSNVTPAAFGNPNAAVKTSGTGTSTGSSGGGSGAEQSQQALGKSVSYDRVKAAVLKKGYKWYGNEMEINIVGVRNISGQKDSGHGKLHPITNRFNDILIVAWIENGKTNAESYPATTVPGASYTLASNPKFSNMNPKGTGAKQEGQWLAHYYAGAHKGHPAMRDRTAIGIHRDNNYTDSWIDLATSPKGKAPGLFNELAGMLIHNSGDYGDPKTKLVNNWSAGCQVLANQAQTNRLVALTEKSTKKTGNKFFTYTLINSSEIQL